MRELSATPADYRRNKNLIFDLIEVQLTEVLPPKVMAQYGQFAEIRTFAQGDRAIFYQRITEASRRRAKQFVTRAALAGRYEVFRLDGRSMEVPMGAYGGAANIAWEEFLDGRIQMSDVFDLVLEGLDEAIYRDIANELKHMADTLPVRQLTIQTQFEESEMDKLLTIADTYGKAAIYCTFEFASTMLPDTGWISDEMRNTRWNNGYLGNYKGHQVIILAQSFEDETNAMKVIDPAYAYIVPTGSEKPVKIAFEGSAQVKEEDNDDWSKTIHTYQKVGVAVYGVNPGICAYKNTSLAKAM